MVSFRRKYLIFIGIFLINIPNGFTWYFGNLSAYTTSALRYYLGPDVDVETVWLMSIFLAMWTAGIMIGGIMQRYYPNPRLIIFIGLIMFDGGFAATSWTIRHSLWLYIMSLGAFAGLADGLICSACMSLIAKWEDERLGLVTALATSGLGVGAVIINQIVPRYLNPDNLVADKEDGNLTLFSQDDIVSKVPKLFLLLAGIYVAFHLVGFAFLQVRKRQGHWPDKKTEEAMVEEKSPLLQGENAHNDSHKQAVEKLQQQKNYEQENRFISSDAAVMTNGNQYSDAMLENELHIHAGKSIISPISSNGPLSNQLVSNNSTSQVRYPHRHRVFSEGDFPEQAQANDLDTAYQKQWKSLDSILTGSKVELGNVRRGLFLDNWNARYYEMLGRNAGTRDETTEYPTTQLYTGSGLHSTKGSQLSTASAKHHMSDAVEKAQPLEFAKDSMAVPFEAQSLAPRQVLTTRMFYLLWVAQFCLDYTLTVLTNYYKLFGEIYIPNDRFLANLGTVMTATMIIPKLGWGILLDKFGVKVTMAAMASTSVAFASFWYYTATINRWLYSVVTVGLCWCVCAFDSVFPAAVLLAFGPGHYNVNYGMVTSASILLNLISPLVMQFFLDNYGWPWLFLSTAGFNVIVVIQSLFCLDLNIATV